ncbi:uncharacterized protein UTRI_04665 [Ustilago trichophora]|uniref:Uncharacterized protein n=1 Tax=Ustilago trichophora TaxID=86804 RepID=A0A5C3EGD1_9BASI|nr:uncharacterized protein UTRI_04665 [Ustilago trichophora]
MTNTDVEDVNLLEWSYELDRGFLKLPFRPLRSSTSDPASTFLYKLAHSSARNQLGFLLLDCDACTAFYEGISLRTANRRTQLAAAAAVATTTTAAASSTTAHLDSDENSPRLKAIVAAIHHALDPHTARNPSLKTKIDLETTRFSSSLSISVKSTNDQDERIFKTTFDLDPLDHASLSDLLSLHFVRPLLSLAAAFATNATSSFLGNTTSHNLITSDLLELLRRSALTQAGLPISTQFDADNPSQTTDLDSPRSKYERARPIASPTHTKNPKPFPLDFEIGSASSDEAFRLDSLDDHSDLLFFGPPGCFLPQTKHKAVYVDPNSNKRTKSTSPVPEQSSDDGDTTLTARLDSSVRPAYHASATLVDDNNNGQAPSTIGDQQHDSDTSEEESLPVLGSSIASMHPSSFVAAQSHLSKDVDRPERASETDISPESKGNKLLPSLRQTSPTLTPPPPSFNPTASQISPSRANAARDEQLRRRQEIARIKRGANAPPASSTSSVATSASARTAAPSRKRSRF